MVSSSEVRHTRLPAVVHSQSLTHSLARSVTQTHSVCVRARLLMVAEFAKYTVRLDCNDWNAEFVPANNARSVIEASEGSMHVDAGGGYGGRVRLELPSIPPPSPQPRPTPSPQPHPSYFLA